jgi:hypothetical protein
MVTIPTLAESLKSLKVFCRLNSKLQLFLNYKIKLSWIFTLCAHRKKKWMTKMELMRKFFSLILHMHTNTPMRPAKWVHKLECEYCFYISSKNDCILKKLGRHMTQLSAILRHYGFWIWSKHRAPNRDGKYIPFIYRVTRPLNGFKSIPLILFSNLVFVFGEKFIYYLNLNLHIYICEMKLVGVSEGRNGIKGGLKGVS